MFEDLSEAASGWSLARKRLLSLFISLQPTLTKVGFTSAQRF